MWDSRPAAPHACPEEEASAGTKRRNATDSCVSSKEEGKKRVSREPTSKRSFVYPIPFTAPTHAVHVHISLNVSDFLASFSGNTARPPPSRGSTTESAVDLATMPASSLSALLARLERIERELAQTCLSSTYPPWASRPCFGNAFDHHRVQFYTELSWSVLF